MSCPSATSYLAVGYSMLAGGNPLAPACFAFAESWDGTSWKTVPPVPVGMVLSTLMGVSCTSATACTAVGYHKNGSVIFPLAERWNGTAETQPPAVRAELLVELGEAKLQAGLDDAAQHILEALALSADPRRRAQMCRALGSALLSTGDWAGASRSAAKDRRRRRATRWCMPANPARRSLSSRAR